MLRRNLVAGAITALMVSPAFAFLDKVGLGGGNSGKAVDADSFNKSRTDLEKKYILAAAAVLASQIDLAQALNVKADIAQAEELNKVLKGGNLSSDTVEKVSSTSRTLNEQLKKGMEETDKLSAKQKKLVGSGLVKYAAGVAMTAALGIEAKHVAESATDVLKSANPISKVKLASELGACLAIGKELPSHAKNLVTGGNQMVQIATKKGVSTKGAKKKLAEAANFDF